MDSDRGALQRQFDFAREDAASPPANLLRQESTDPASMDQPALSVELASLRGTA